MSCKTRPHWAYEPHPYRRFLTPPIPCQGVDPMVHSWVRFELMNFVEGRCISSDKQDNLSRFSRSNSFRLVSEVTLIINYHLCLNLVLGLTVWIDVHETYLCARLACHYVSTHLCAARCHGRLPAILVGIFQCYFFWWWLAWGPACNAVTCLSL